MTFTGVNREDRPAATRCDGATPNGDPIPQPKLK